MAKGWASVVGVGQMTWLIEACPGHRCPGAGMVSGVRSEEENFAKACFCVCVFVSFYDVVSTD